MIDSVVSTLQKAERDESIRVVVLTGEGKNFCSGGDLKNMMNQSEMFAGESNELRQRYEHLYAPGGFPGAPEYIRCADFAARREDHLLT